MSSSAPAAHQSSRFDHRKRHRNGAPAGAGVPEIDGMETDDVAQLSERVRELEEERRQLLSPLNAQGCQGVFDMQVGGERTRLGRAIWEMDFEMVMSELRAANAPLLRVLDFQTRNTTPLSEIGRIHKSRQLDGLLVDICRAQSIHKVPLITVALSILCRCDMVKRDFHDAITFLFKGALMSEKWTNDFMTFASDLRPPPTDPTIPGVMVCVFDNLTMNINYKSYSSQGHVGEKLDMTNWFSVLLPAHLAPPLDGEQACVLDHLPKPTASSACSPAAMPTDLKGIFRHRAMTLTSFCRLFHLDNPQIVANKKQRWYNYLQAAASGTLLDRPQIRHGPVWVPYKMYQEQMPDVLQSAYEDVEHEFRVMTKHARAHGVSVLFVAGDGLALMRGNHLLASKRHLYIDQSPVIIPIQGAPTQLIVTYLR